METNITLSLRITSSIASRLAFAIICMTCRLSCPPPILAAPPAACCVWLALVAPERALNVPANADEDQLERLGRFEARGDEVVCDGFEE